MATNYAAIIGIQNKWAPIVFAVLYFLVMVWYIAQAVRRHALVYAALAFFSALRVISFSLRAAMASNHHNDAFNRKMAIAYEVLYNVGFFSVLLSAYRLLHDRRRLGKLTQAREKGQGFLRAHRILDTFHKGRFMEILLLLCIILGAVGAADTFGTDSGRARLGNRLSQASTYIFLVVTLIVALLTLLLIHLERSLLNRGTSAGNSSSGAGGVTTIGSTTQHLVLLGVAVLLLLRMLFYAATIHQRATGQPTPTSTLKQTAMSNEHLWYPLAALAELLVVLLFLMPGLVPLRSMLQRAMHGDDANAHLNEKGANGNGANRNPNTTGAGYNAGDTAATGGGLGAHEGLNAV